MLLANKINRLATTRISGVKQLKTLRAFIFLKIKKINANKRFGAGFILLRRAKKG